MKQLEEIKARASAATALGKWETTRSNDVVIYDPNGFGAYRPIAHADAKEDADFIAAARTDVPKLVAALEAIEEVLTWLDAIDATETTKRVATGSHIHAGPVAGIIREAIDKALEAA